MRCHQRVEHDRLHQVGSVLEGESQEMGLVAEARRSYAHNMVYVKVLKILKQANRTVKYVIPG
jgi:hypothetical protein